MATVVQYNILSSGLSSPQYHIRCSPADLDPSIRFDRVIQELSLFIDEKAIINLQEVSQTWLGPLCDFFTARDYVMISSPYGFYLNDYMGNAIAYPREMYTTESTKIKVVGAKIPTPKPVTHTRWQLFIQKVFLILITMGLVKKRKDPIDEWVHSRNRTNTIIMTTFTCQETGAKFVIANYHMPCTYWAPKVSTIHTIESMKIAQQYARKLPLIFAGDFNFTPDSYQYTSVISGEFPPSPQYPDTTGVKWDSKIYPMQSAYATLYGKEPDLTVQSTTKDMKEPFRGTLDYIFYSGKCYPSSGEEVPVLHEDTMIPNDIHPSDHLPLKVVFEF